MDVFCKVRCILSYGLKSNGYLHKREIKRFYDKYKSNPYPMFIYEDNNVIGRIDDIFLHNSALYGNVIFYKKEDYSKEIKACFNGVLKGHSGYKKPKRIYPIKIKSISHYVIK